MLITPAPIRWESNNNFGFKCITSGIIADVTPHTDRKSGHVTYVASVKVLSSLAGIQVPNDQRREFDDRMQAKIWCEEWIQYFHTHRQMQETITCYQNTLKYYMDEFYLLKAKINEQEWEKYRERFNTIIQDDSIGEQGGER